MVGAFGHDPQDEIHVLFVDGVPAGFVELDRRVEDEIEVPLKSPTATEVGPEPTA
jgi:hypothetical protein